MGKDQEHTKLAKHVQVPCPQELERIPYNLISWWSGTSPRVILIALFPLKCLTNLSQQASEGFWYFHLGKALQDGYWWCNGRGHIYFICHNCCHMAGIIMCSHLCLFTIQCVPHMLQSPPWSAVTKVREWVGKNGWISLSPPACLAEGNPHLLSN